MSWIPFTVNDVPLWADEIEKVTAAAGRGDLLSPIVTGVIREIVGKVAVRNPLGEDGTIPSELWEAARSMALYRFLTEARSDELLTDGVKTRNAEAVKLVDSVTSADGLKIVPPETYAPVQAQSPSPRVTPRTARYAPSALDGV